MVKHVDTVEKSTFALELRVLPMLTNSEIQVMSICTYYILFSVQNTHRVHS